MLKKTHQFFLPDDPAPWRFRIEDKVRPFVRVYTVIRDGQTLHQETVPIGDEPMSGARRIQVADHDVAIDYGPVSLWSYGVVVHQANQLIWRSTDKPFRDPSKFDEVVERWESENDKAELTPEEQARAERQAALRPSIYVDLCFGILFFFVAREFGLIAAALTGAGATLLLFAINPFVKWDLLGGFAAFGAVMALISAGLAWSFQDDLAIKLRGTIMACIGAGFALFDGVVLKGGYLGNRLALYMEWMGELDPRRASLAMAAATLLIMGIDTPLAFILTTDQWIWYNAFLDSLIAIPILLGSIYLFARIRPETS